MSLSQIAKSIGASPTLALNAEATALRKEGKPIIHLGGGEPKSKAPASAIQETIKHLNTGEVRYAPVGGIPELKESIIQYTEKYYNRKVAPQNIIASGGAKQAIMIALQTVLDPLDEVIYPAPFWVSYPDMVKLCGAVPVVATTADGSTYPSIKDIENKVTAKTKAVIINSPNNPSGAAYSDEFVSDIVEFCEKRDIYLIIDDIYHRLIFDGRKSVQWYNYAKDLSEKSKLILINGVSKSFAMTGFRLGWAVANKEIIRTMINIQGHQTSGSSILSQKGALGALNDDHDYVEELRATLEKRRNLMFDFLGSLEGVKIAKPEGTFYCYPDFSYYEKDSTKLSTFLVKKVQVLTLPGVIFGNEGYLRLSYCGNSSDITEGMNRIKWALDPNSPKEINIGGETVIKDW